MVQPSEAAAPDPLAGWWIDFDGTESSTPEEEDAPPDPELLRQQEATLRQAAEVLSHP